VTKNPDERFALIQIGQLAKLIGFNLRTLHYLEQHPPPAISGLFQVARALAAIDFAAFGRQA
jgi:hypothetical protein